MPALHTAFYPNIKAIEFAAFRHEISAHCLISGNLAVLSQYMTEKASTNNTPCRPQPRPFPNHKQDLATEKQPRSRAPEIYSTAGRQVDQAYSEDSRSSRGVPVGALRCERP
ncbi:hypothetical protein ElyMa_000524600 [Elysia marginata]|uniref:Uncharacterized protein n=1 Tax=Elysia marginata TaxID=1093978 RepID=A0AAV4FXJ0_9GAST|nr:hypothetical protein ElyMa_000524600 [Elysia marginata]